MTDNNNEEDLNVLVTNKFHNFKDNHNTVHDCLSFPSSNSFHRNFSKSLFTSTIDKTGQLYCAKMKRKFFIMNKNYEIFHKKVNKHFNHSVSMSSSFLKILVLIFFIITSTVVCDTHSLSSITFPYASASTFPSAPLHSATTVSGNANTISSTSSPSVPVMSSPTTTTQAMIMNRSTTLADLIQASSTRQTPTSINFLQFCMEPPVVANAQSNLKSNQKHYVFQLIATYVCDQGYRPVVGSDHVNTTRCTFQPNLSPSSTSNVVFPDSSVHESLRSGRAKNSKRLIEIDEEPDANLASANRVTSVQFNDKHKSGRSEDFAYDTSPEAFLSGKNSDLENDSDVLEHKKQKIEKIVRTGQRPQWYPAITLKCERVTCNDPGEVEHSMRKLSSSEGFVYNSYVYYDCSPGYKAVGIPILLCRSDGTWNRSPPKCVLKQCPLLPAIKNGRVLYSGDRKIDSQAEYHCDAGYRLNADNHVRHCGEDSAWSTAESLNYDQNSTTPEMNDPYRCVPVECPPPVRPHSGLRILSEKKKKKRYFPGDIIIYSCQTIKTRSTARCNDNGEWNREPPPCPQMRSKCPTLPFLAHGRIDVVDNEATFICQDGYFLQGPPKITCLSKGIWNDTFASCILEEMKSNSVELESNTTNAEAATDPTEIKMSQPSRTITFVILTFLAFVTVFAAIGTTFFCRWRQQKIQRERWRQYFGHYHHRQSKTNIVMNRDHLTARNVTSKMTSRRSRSGSNSKSTQAFLQSSFSSSDEQNADNKSVQTGVGTLTSEQARTMSTFADDCTTTCADDDFEDFEEAENELENLYITSATILAADNAEDNKIPEPMIQLSTPETQTRKEHHEERPSSVLLDPLYNNYAGLPSGSSTSRPMPAPRVLGPKPGPALPVTDL